MVFVILTLSANLLKVETTPFFIWGMYSEKEENANNYKILEVLVNDTIRVDYSSTFSDANRFYLLSPLTYSLQILQNEGKDPAESFLRKKTGKFFMYINPLKAFLFNDSADQKGFIKWYAKYLEGTIHIKVDQLQVNELEFVYNDKGRPELKNKIILAIWKQ